MKAGFPPSPEPIQGITMLQSLIELLFHLCRGAQTQRFPASATMNLLFCAAPCNVYAFLSSEVYHDAFVPFPPEIPNVPDFTACVDDNDRATVQAMHVHNKKTRADIVTMNTALAGVFLEVMSSQVRASFQKHRLHKPNIVFVDLFLCFVEQYGKTMAKDRKANRQRMATNLHPIDGFDALILCLFTGAVYASSAGFKMNNVDFVNIGLRIINQCGMYSKEYKAWIARKSICPAITKTFDTFKTFWVAKITLVNQTAIPASLHGYGMATVNDDDTLVVSYGKSIANFGAAYAATQEFVKTQGSTNATLQGQVNAMQQYCMAIQQQPPPLIYVVQQQRGPNNRRGSS